MNDKIELLAKQAYESCFDDAYHSNYTTDRVNAVFAQLLVRECCNVILHYSDVDEGVAVAKKHFGVK